MERGVDTKIVVKEFATLREAHDKLIEHTSKQFKDLSFENTQLKSQNDNLMLNLKKQQEKVVRPLIIEAQKQEAIV